MAGKFWYMLFRDPEDQIWLWSDPEGVVHAEKTKRAFTDVSSRNILEQIGLSSTLKARVARLRFAEVRDRAGPPYHYGPVPMCPVSDLAGRDPMAFMQGPRHGLLFRDQDWAKTAYEKASPIIPEKT
jgi:hypothetical protein